MYIYPNRICFLSFLVKKFNIKINQTYFRHCVAILPISVLRKCTDISKSKSKSRKYNILSKHALQTVIDFIEDIKKHGLGHLLLLCPAYLLIISGLCQKFDGCNFFEPLSFLKSTKFTESVPPTGCLGYRVFYIKSQLVTQNLIQVELKTTFT